GAGAVRIAPPLRRDRAGARRVPQAGDRPRAAAGGQARARHRGPGREAGPRPAADALGHAGDHAVRDAQGRGAAAGGHAMSRRSPRRSPAPRAVAYTSSPLLASRTPVWRSKLIVAGIALAFVGLAG